MTDLIGFFLEAPEELPRLRIQLLVVVAVLLPLWCPSSPQHSLSASTMLLPILASSHRGSCRPHLASHPAPISLLPSLKPLSAASTFGLAGTATTAATMAARALDTSYGPEGKFFEVVQWVPTFEQRAADPEGEIAGLAAVRRRVEERAHSLRDARQTRRRHALHRSCDSAGTDRRSLPGPAVVPRCGARREVVAAR